MMTFPIRILRRKCDRCGKKKPNTRKCWDFSKDTPEHLHRICIRCESAEAKRRYYAEHKDEIAEAQRRYYAEHKDEIAEAHRRRRADRLRATMTGLVPVRSIQLRHTLMRQRAALPAIESEAQ